MKVRSHYLIQGVKWTEIIYTNQTIRLNWCPDEQWRWTHGIVTVLPGWFFFFELRWWCWFGLRSFCRSALVLTELVLLVALCCLLSFSFRVINGTFHVSPPSWKCQVHLQGVCGSSQVTIPLFSGISFVKSWAPTLKYLKARKGVSITIPACFDGDSNLSCKTELAPGEGQTPTLMPWKGNSVQRKFTGDFCCCFCTCSSLFCFAVVSSTAPSTILMIFLIFLHQPSLSHKYWYFPASLSASYFPFISISALIYMQVPVFICMFTQQLPFPFSAGLREGKVGFGSHWQNPLPQLQNSDFYSICWSFLKPFPIIINIVCFRVVLAFFFSLFKPLCS